MNSLEELVAAAQADFAAAADAAALENAKAKYLGKTGQVTDLMKDNESMAKVFESDDRLAAATAEIKRLNALVTVLEDRNRGMMNECNEAKRLARSWKNRFEKLERECRDAGLVEF